MFKKKAPEYKVIEIDKGTKLPQMTGDLKESLKTLPHHPAFSYLMQKMRYDKAALGKYLQEGFELSDQQLRYMQAGMFWLGYLEREISRLTQTSSSPRPALDNEQAEFERIRANVDLVGA